MAELVHGRNCNCTICADRRTQWARIKRDWPDLAKLLLEIADLGEPAKVEIRHWPGEA